MMPWETLSQWSEEQLGTIDLAAVNLACAAGLPGVGGFVHRAYLETMDELAHQVKRRTASLYTKF